jgi:hypothetical protein
MQREQIFTKRLHALARHAHACEASSSLYVRLPCTGTAAPVLVMRAHEL